MVKTMHRDTKAFTLVELLVVMGIILILVSIALPATNAARSKAKDMEVKKGCNDIQAALEKYGVAKGGYPGVQWIQDSNGDYFAGPGLIGGLPTYNGAEPQKDFYVPKDDSDARGPGNQAPYFPDETPNPSVLDALIVSGELTDYPANPFVRTNGGLKAQMSNLFLFSPQGVNGDTQPDVSDPNTINWNRYLGSSQSMRANYADYGRGHFTYIPLNPQNLSGTDFAGNWGALSGQDRSEYYAKCKGYILIGWGGSRADDSQAKGLSEKYWSNSASAFDFDNSLVADPLEQVLSNVTPAGILRGDVTDSDGGIGTFGQTLPGGGPDIDNAFYGATFIKITGS